MNIWLIYLIIFTIIDVFLVSLWFFKMSDDQYLTIPLIVYSTDLLVFSILTYSRFGLVYTSIGPILFAVATIIAGFTLITLMNNIFRNKLSPEAAQKWKVHINILDICCIVLLVLMVVAGFMFS